MNDIPPDKQYLVGCAKCSYGIVGTPDYRKFLNLPLPEIRVLLAKVGRLQFCDCPAGVAALSAVRNTALRMRQDPYYTDERREALLERAATPTVNGGA